jgi:Ca2+-binding EF-hand superfamily protein
MGFKKLNEDQIKELEKDFKIYDNENKGEINLKNLKLLFSRIGFLIILKIKVFIKMMRNLIN